MSSVEPVDCDTTMPSIDNAIKDGIAPATNKLFPRISPAVTSVNVASILVNKEYPEMVCIRFARSCESGAVLAKIHDVVDADSINIDRAHITPPIESLVVVRAPTRWVNPWRRDPARPSLTTLAAFPATEGCSWVKVIELIESIKAVGSTTAP